MALIHFVQTLTYSSGGVQEPLPPPVESAIVLKLNPTSVQISGVNMWIRGGTGSTKILYFPSMLYHNGRTYHAYPSDNQTDPYSQIRMVVFDNVKGFDRPVIVGEPRTFTDTHFAPAMAIAIDPSDSTERINVVQEFPHNGPLDVWRSNYGTDEIRFSKLAFDIGTTLAYAHILKKDNGNFAIWCRATTNWHGYVIESTNNFQSWGTQRQITQSPATTFYRHYPSVPFGRQKVNGKWHVMHTMRKDDGVFGGSVAHSKYYLLKTDDSFNVYTNVEETWSQDVTVSGVITDATLEANAMYFQNNQEDIDSQYPNSGLSSDGVFAVTVSGPDGNINNSRFIYYIPGSGWTNKALNISNLMPGPTGMVGDYMMVFGANDIRCVQFINVGGFSKPQLFRTTNLGDTWTMILDFAPEINANLGLSIPTNIMDIPPNVNFPIELRKADADINNTIVYFKVAAWNNIQTIPGETITPAVSMNYNSTGLFHYKCDNANIVRSGNNVTQLTDLFGLRNATGVNNPQWNGSDSVSVVAASSQGFNIASPANIVNKSAGTFMAVVKVTPGVLFLPLCISNQASALDCIDLRVNTDGTVGYRITISTTALCHGFGAAIADGNPHLITVCWDGRAAVDIYLDMERLYFRTNLAAGSSMWANIGKGAAGVSASVARLGYRDNTSDAYTTGSFMELLLYSDVLPTNELRPRMKKLCNDYSITPVSQFLIPS